MKTANHKEAQQIREYKDGMRDTGIYVWNPRADAPTTEHGSGGLANDEAARLARKHRGETFYVIRCLGKHRLPKAPSFGDLPVGAMFRHGNRVLMKTQRWDGGIPGDEYNAVRLAPPDVAGKLSVFSDDSAVEKIS